MAFLVEDGTRVTGANALADVSFCDTHHADRDHATWAPLSTPKKQAAIIRATDYLQKRFSRRWKGSKVDSRQSLDWPRFNVWDNNKLILALSTEIPLKLKQAVAEYALRASLVGELAPDQLPMSPPQDLSNASYVMPTEYEGGTLRRVNTQIDVIQENKTYERPDTLSSTGKNKQTLSNLVNESLIPEYPAADLLLEDFLCSSTSRRIARA